MEYLHGVRRRPLRRVLRRQAERIFVPHHLFQVRIRTDAGEGADQVTVSEKQKQELFRKLMIAESRTAIKRAELDAAVLAEKNANSRYKECK